MKHWPVWAQNCVIGVVIVVCVFILVASLLPILGLLAHAMWDQFMIGWGSI